MKELMTRIEDWMDKNKHGWSSKERVSAFVGVIAALRPATVLEIGIWSGRSLIPMAMTMQHFHVKGKIIGIDPWEKTSSCQGLEGDHLKWWSEVNHDAIYRTFIDELVAQGVMPYVEIHRCRSDEFNLENIKEIDLAHIDGNHGEAASLYDVTNYAPKIRVGGFLFMDDVEWAKKAADMIPTLGFERLYALDGGYMYQKVKP